MFKKIVIKGSEYDFKCSAATSILYKRLFGKSLQNEMIEFAGVSSQAVKFKNKWESLNADGNIEKITELLANDDSLVKLSTMTAEVVPQMAYVMWLEANKPQREVFQGLTEDAYISWLSGFDSDDLTGISGEIIELWNGSQKTHSNLKNA